MEDTFRVRVDKTFGSLSTASSNPSSSTTNIASLTSLWSLTDDELHRDQWIRDDDDQPDPFPFEKFETGDTRVEMERDLDELELEDDKDEEEKSLGLKPDGFNDEEWEIKNSIGRDFTLDFEEEEDAYDKVAVGKEKTGDCLYMSDVTDYVIDEDNCYVLPSSFNEATRDPRANVIAAKLRLKEDAEAAKKMNSLYVTKKDKIVSKDSPYVNSEDDNLKSILKRKDENGSGKPQQEGPDSKSQKRVRFDPEFKEHRDEESGATQEIQMETDTVGKTTVFPIPPDYPSGVPDYMRNPTKYTRYTFDLSSDVDDNSNRQAYMDFLNMLRKPKDTENQSDNMTFDLPKSVPFMPKRKSDDTVISNNGTELKQHQVRIVASETIQDEASAMEEDESDAIATKRSSSHRTGRQYRTKAQLESDD